MASGGRDAGDRRRAEPTPHEAARHLALLTRTTEVVNSSLDLQDVLEAIAHEVAAALGTDACFVYLYDERADELVLRATHGTRIEDETSAPRMRSGVGITGVAAAERTAIMLPSGACVRVGPREPRRLAARPSPPERVRHGRSGGAVLRRRRDAEAE